MQKGKIHPLQRKLKLGTPLKRRKKCFFNDKPQIASSDAENAEKSTAIDKLRAPFCL